MPTKRSTLILALILAMVIISPFVYIKIQHDQTIQRFEQQQLELKKQYEEAQANEAKIVQIVETDYCTYHAENLYQGPDGRVTFDPAQLQWCPDVLTQAQYQNMLDGTVKLAKESGIVVTSGHPFSVTFMGQTIPAEMHYEYMHMSDGTDQKSETYSVTTDATIGAITKISLGSCIPGLTGFGELVINVCPPAQ